MSIKIMSMVWDVKELTPMQKLIVLKLADNADDGGVCWPSLETVAGACGCSSRTVMRAIDHFKVLGILSSTRRYNKSNKYYFNSDTMSLLKSNSDTMSRLEVTPCHMPPDTVSPLESLKVTPCHVNGDTGVHLTIKNHKENEELDKSEALESNTTQQAEVGTKPSWLGWTDQSSRPLRSAPAIGAYIFNPKTGEQIEYEGT